MKTYLHLELTHRAPLPAIFQNDDVRYPESLLEHFLQEYTRPGDVVLDPFAGYGTTLFVAERMGRIPLGVELNKAKVDYVRSRLSRPEAILHGDSRSLKELDLPEIDFSMTSPPYMNKDDPENPFSDYQAEDYAYSSYLRDIRSIYEQLGTRMKPQARVVLEVANLKRGGQVTTLAWDIGRVISEVLHFQGEIVVCWDKYGYGYDHSYCLVFSVE